MMDHIADDEIWRRVREANYNWHLGRNAIQKIEKLIGSTVPNNDYINSVDGRKAIGSALQGPNKNAVATWIVRDWGGIKRGSTETIHNWMFLLKDFNDHKVDDFIKKNGVTRISSWSKILAFAAPEKHAIYDSRTATALNCILFKNNCDVHFYMPPSRNKRVIFIQNHLKKYAKNIRPLLCYIKYIEILDHLVSKGKFSNKLEAEQKLFAFAVNDDLCKYLGITPPLPSRVAGERCGGRSKVHHDFPA